MSSFLGTTSGTAGVGIQQYADPACILRIEEYNDPNIYWVPPQSAWYPIVAFTSPWWPRGAGLDASGGGMLEAVGWALPTFYSGAISKMAFIGVTRDAYGSILPSCITKLFKTTDGAYAGTKDVLLDQTTSDATTGAYTLYTLYYPDAHYIVAYKAGSPDVEGTTVNTLIGA